MPIFQWTIENNPDYYILRIERFLDRRLHFVGIIQSNYLNDIESFDPNSPNSIYMNDFIPGVEYWWRVDCIGDDTPLPSGSESNWKSFSVN